MHEFDDNFNIEQTLEEIEIKTTMTVAIAAALAPKDYQVWYLFNSLSMAFIGAMTVAEEDDDSELFDRAMLFGQEVNTWITDLFSQTLLSETVDLPQEFHAFVKSNVGWTFEAQKRMIKMLSENI